MFLDSWQFFIRQNQAFSGHFRQDQAKSGTNRLLEPRVHFLTNVSELRISHMHATRWDRAQKPKRGWIHFVMVSWGHSLWLSEGLVSRHSLSLSPKQKERPSNKRNQIDTFIIRVCLPIMLKPRGLGRRVPKAPTLFRHSQTIPSKKHIKQNQSLSGFHVIVICFRLSKRIQAPFRTIPSKIRQNQAISGKIRQFQAKSGLFQAFSGRIRQNLAKSGKIGQPIGSGKSLVRDPMLFQKPQTAPPFWAEFFWLRSIKTKAQTNYNQTASNGIILPKTWQLCWQILDIATVYWIP